MKSKRGELHGNLSLVASCSDIQVKPGLETGLVCVCVCVCVYVCVCDWRGHSLVGLDHYPVASDGISP